MDSSTALDTKIVQATTSLREFFETRGAKLMDTIRTEKQLNDTIEADLESAFEEWQAGFTA